jgi:hypothetical protein
MPEPTPAPNRSESPKQAEDWLRAQNAAAEPNADDRLKGAEEPDESATAEQPPHWRKRWTTAA